LPKPRIDFNVLRDGNPIATAAVWTDIQVVTGIAYARQLPGCIPFFEEYDAMKEAGYNEREWMELSPIERAMAVAHYRIRKYVSLHEADAVELKRKSKGGK
jgi:hypothetical protein